MNKREAGKRETRALLLATARDLFVERGVDEATTRELAERAGVGVGTVFAHFPDKVALVEAVLVDRIDRALEQAFADLPAGDLVDQLLHVARSLYATYAEHPAISRALVGQALFLAGDRPTTRQIARFREWVLARLAESGRPADPSDFTGFFALYFAVLVAGLRGELPLEQLADALEPLLRRWFGGSS
jgi:AcrR family transcriptional regulator